MSFRIPQSKQTKIRDLLPRSFAVEWVETAPEVTRKGREKPSRGFHLRTEGQAIGEGIQNQFIRLARPDTNQVVGHVVEFVFESRHSADQARTIFQQLLHQPAIALDYLGTVLEIKLLQIL